jgi:hypothetical protein
MLAAKQKPTKDAEEAPRAKNATPTCLLPSRTMKQAALSSIDQGAGSGAGLSHVVRAFCDIHADFYVYRGKIRSTWVDSSAAERLAFCTANCSHSTDASKNIARAHSSWLASAFRLLSSALCR